MQPSRRQAAAARRWRGRWTSDPSLHGRRPLRARNKRHRHPKCMRGDRDAVPPRSDARTPWSVPRADRR
ncbi:MAG: hypothetical protein C0496_03030 [Erythrobacter sp.]|nr:hypothetical protein [Erythrobacter sp.]MBA4209204.1 hypothetical protein [Parvibaculum sp.]